MNKCLKKASLGHHGTCGDHECKLFIKRFSSGCAEEKTAVDTYTKLVDMNDSENAILWYFTTIIPMSLNRRSQTRKRAYKELSTTLLEGQRAHLAICKCQREEDLTAESPPPRPPVNKKPSQL